MTEEHILHAIKLMIVIITLSIVYGTICWLISSVIDPYNRIRGTVLMFCLFLFGMLISAILSISDRIQHGPITHKNSMTPKDIQDLVDARDTGIFRQLKD